MKNVLTIVAILAALAALSIPVQAAVGPCGIRADVLAELAKKYQENPVGIGVTNEGNLMELLKSANGSTWTIIETMPDGPTCLRGAGTDWFDKETDPGDAV